MKTSKLVGRYFVLANMKENPSSLGSKPNHGEFVHSSKADPYTVS